jgi:hypothetical protein
MLKPCLFSTRKLQKSAICVDVKVFYRGIDPPPSTLHHLVPVLLALYRCEMTPPPHSVIAHCLSISTNVTANVFAATTSASVSIATTTSVSDAVAAIFIPSATLTAMLTTTAPAL